MQCTLHFTSQWVRLRIQTHHTGSFCKKSSWKSMLKLMKLTGVSAVSKKYKKNIQWCALDFWHPQQRETVKHNFQLNCRCTEKILSSKAWWLNAKTKSISLLKDPRKSKNYPLCLRKETKCWAKDEFMKWVEGDTVKRVAYIQHSYLTKANLLFTLHSTGTYAAHKF